jgi:putative tryptophan/tyrosine transport system substrate-binding protein
MKRREFITLLGGAAGWPLAARAQQPAVPVIGFLSSRAAGADPYILTAFRQGLNEIGFVEGQNVTIEFRFAEGKYDRFPAFAADLVSRQVSLIVSSGGLPAALAAKAATATIPVVFSLGDDPVKTGLVGSLNRPGGNLTGSTLLNAELGPKRLDLLHELLPAVTTIAVLLNPSNRSAEPLSKELLAAARTLGVQIHILHASTERDFEAAIGQISRVRAGALMIGNDPFYNSRIAQLATLTLRHAVPTIYQYPQFVAAGGLMSYGGSLTDSYRLVGRYAGRILKGEKPADLPVQQSTKVELIINIKTARTLGLEVPPTLLARADEVIE